MKYISPETEKRKKQQKKRKKQIVICGVLLLVILTIAISVFVLKDVKNNQDSSSNINTSVVVDNSSNSNIEQNNSTTENNDDKKEENQQKPSKPKKSLWKKITSIFSKDKQPNFVYPAISFGVTIEQPATKIISLSPFATEAILSSQSQNALIAVSEYCDKHGREDLLTVGTPLIPKADEIINLAPDYLIIQNPISETDKIKIEQSGIKILTLNVPKNMEELKEIYRSISALTCGAEQATLLGERFYNDIQEKIGLYKSALQNVSKKSVVMIFNNYGMLATTDTIEADLLSNFFDVVSDGENYFTSNMENIISSNPEIIIVSDTVTEEQLKDMGFAETDAFKNGNVFYINIKEFENISPRAIKTIAEITNQVYGDQITPQQNISE